MGFKDNGKRELERCTHSSLLIVLLYCSGEGDYGLRSKASTDRQQQDRDVVDLSRAAPKPKKLMDSFDPMESDGSFLLLFASAARLPSPRSFADRCCGRSNEGSFDTDTGVLLLLLCCVVQSLLSPLHHNIVHKVVV